MFTYLRYFTLISIVLFIAGAAVVSYLVRNTASEDIELLVKGGNIGLARSFHNMVWRPYYEGALAAGQTPEQARATLLNAVQHFAPHQGVFHFTLYDPAGNRLFTSGEPSFSHGGKPGLEIYELEKLATGSVTNRLVKNATPVAAPETGLSLVQTAWPIPNPLHVSGNPACAVARPPANLCGPIAGIVEIISDVTPQVRRVDTVQNLSVGAMIGIFGILISLLFFTSRRAESIISKQHEVNLELTAAAASAEAENRDKSQFLANISHELRTPLNAIIGFSEIIRNEAMQQLPPTYQEYIEDIHGSGKHLLSLINDILDYSKAEAGKLELELAEVDATKVIKNSMRLVIPRAEEAQVTLIEEFPGAHFVITTDAKKLKQVLLNLLSNAVKFTPAGGEVRVTAWEQLVEGQICIQVKDTGIGIAPKDISRVMTPFGQVDSTLSRRYEGTGLGLPLSKKLVETMGGEFQIESQEKVGTTITIKLPRNPQQRSQG